MTRFTNVSNYGKFISNIYFAEAAKIGVVRVKARFGEWISKDGLIRNFFFMRGVTKLLVGKILPSIKQLYKKSSMFFFL